MHTLHTTSRASSQGIGSLSSSFAAFASALGGAAVTSRVAFDHQPPSRPEDVATYLATLAAAVIIGWWLANVLAWAVALRRGVQLDRFTLPGTKRIAQIMLAASLSTSCVADANSDPVMVLVEQAEATSTPVAAPPTTAPATTAPPTTAPPTTAPPTTAPTTVTTPSTPSADVPTSDLPPEPSSEPIPEATVAAHSIDGHQVVVNEGDNLWTLAAETLAAHGFEHPSCGQIAEYWRLVVAANQVRSGNPDVIAPGEAITMPSFTFADTRSTPLLTPTAGIGFN